MTRELALSPRSLEASSTSKSNWSFQFTADDVAFQPPEALVVEAVFELLVGRGLDQALVTARGFPKHVV